MNNNNQYEVIEEKGPWPFITRRTYQFPDGAIKTWSSRHHRKGLPIRDGQEKTFDRSLFALCLWLPGRLNWWIGTIFALGSALFVLGSILSLWTGLDKALSLSPTGVNALFFCGSIPFSTAAYLQLYQAAQAELEGVAKGSRSFWCQRVGWYPQSIGWLSAALQFLGTLLFNLNTLDALLPNLDWFAQDLLIWTPDFFGSLLFLASGYLAFIEFGHAHWVWRPASISWWVVSVNLLGCIAFMAAAFFAFLLPGAPVSMGPTVSLVFTLIGAVCFFFGSFLMLPETAVDLLDAV